MPRWSAKDTTLARCIYIVLLTQYGGVDIERGVGRGDIEVRGLVKREMKKGGHKYYEGGDNIRVIRDDTRRVVVKDDIGKVREGEGENPSLCNKNVVLLTY